MNIKKRFYIVLMSILLVVTIGSVGYFILLGGKPAFIDCIYMTVISLTTVGYGEVIEITGNVPAQIFTMVLITFGMGIILYGISTLTALLIEGELTGIIRKEIEFNPPPSLVLKEGMALIVMGEVDNIARAGKVF